MLYIVYEWEIKNVKKNEKKLQKIEKKSKKWQKLDFFRFFCDFFLAKISLPISMVE